MMVRCWLLGLFLLVVSAPAGVATPNVLIILADDCTYNDLPLYGGANAKTPNIDGLARQGLTFDRAYLCEAMCQPCRSEMYSGMYPMSNGCAWNHSGSRPDIKTMPHVLGGLGYRVGIAGKVHVKPKAAYPFEMVDGCERSCVRNPTQPMSLDQIKTFVAKKPPFCLVVALVEPHVPWVMGDPTQYPPQKIQLPANIADTPRTREDFGKYLAEITYMDNQVGEILQALDDCGKSDETLVLFTSEQGSQFPGCKWTNWDTGLHTALVARWPGVVPEGKRTRAIVQYADVLPTLVDVAGGRPATHRFDGASFADVLRGKKDSHRTYSYGLHNNLPEGPPYPIRTVSDGRYRYIRNLLPNEIYIEKHLMGMSGKGNLNNPYWATWVWSTTQSERTYQLVHRYMSRPAEQLYDTQADPYELTNLVNEPGVQAVKQRLSKELDQWLDEQQDPGVPQDTQRALEAARQGAHLYGKRP